MLPAPAGRGAVLAAALLAVMALVALPLASAVDCYIGACLVNDTAATCTSKLSRQALTNGYKCISYMSHCSLVSGVRQAGMQAYTVLIIYHVRAVASSFSVPAVKMYFESTILCFVRVYTVRVNTAADTVRVNTAAARPPPPRTCAVSSADRTVRYCRLAGTLHGCRNSRQHLQVYLLGHR